MPLVTICGLPSSGKTTFSKGLMAYLQENLPKDRNVVLVNEEELHITKAEGYKDAAAEKITRGALKAGVDHALSKQTVVVLDSLNYIKGFRYQLYILARTEATQHCVVWVEAGDKALAHEWNTARNEEGYPPELLDDLWGRFEAPNENSRWDRPLIRFSSVDKDTHTHTHTPDNQQGENEEGPQEEGGETQTQTQTQTHTHAKEEARRKETYKQVLLALTEGKAINSGLSTAIAPRKEADTLYLLDQTTQKVISSLMERQKTAGASSLVGVRVCLSEASVPVVLSRHITLPELKRLRRQFLKQATEWGMAALSLEDTHTHTHTHTQTQTPTQRKERAIGNAFVEYINTQTS